MSNDTDTLPEFEIRISFEKYAHRLLDAMKGQITIDSRPPDGVPLQTQKSEILDFRMEAKHDRDHVTWIFEVTIP